MVRFDNGADNGEPHPHAMRLRGEKGIEDVVEIAGRDTGARIANPDYRMSTIAAGGHDYLVLCAPSSRQRVPCVHDQIEHDLLQLNDIAPDGQIGCSGSKL